MLTRSILPVLVLASLVLSPVARAQGRIHLWGFQRGCERLLDVDRFVEKKLHSSTQPVGILLSPNGKPLPPCQGEKCAELLRRSCQSGDGRLLGGQVVQGRNVTRFRLWLYDLSTGQIAYQDDYNQSYDLSDAFAAQAKALIDRPNFGPALGARPLYCSAGAAGYDQGAAESRGPLYLTVYGEGKHRAALHAALQQQLESLGRSPQPVTVESKTYTSDILEKIVIGQQNARILGAQVKKDGKVELFFFDQKTGLTTDKAVSCADCDRDTLISQAKQSVSELLEHCFGARCAGNGQPPVEACEPFPEQQCPDLDAMLGSSSSAGSDQDHLSPKTARLLKGLAWGAFAASAAASIGLAIANPLTSRDVQDRRFDNTLAGPAVAVAGVSIGLLAVAIPTTVIVNRAQRSSASNSALAPGKSALIQCPN